MSDELNKAVSILRGTPTARAGAAPYTGALMQVVDDASGETLVPYCHFSTFRDAYKVGRRAARHKIFSHVTRAAAVRFEFSRGCFNPTSAREVVFKAKTYRASLPKGEVPESVLRNRRTRTARGMTKTLYRSAHNLDGAALFLSVRGTSDKLNGVRFHVRANPCQSCGCTCRRGRLALNDNGRAKLARLRLRALETVEAALVDARADLSRAQFHTRGVPPVCTARWTDADFESWADSQRALMRVETAAAARVVRLGLRRADLVRALAPNVKA